jgi:hypothetical protein
MEQTELTDSDMDSEIKRYDNAINKDTGYYWWKRYMYAGFWSVSSNPINLCITIFTAITTGQSATGSLFGESVTTSISIATLILSVINTFFKPPEQLRINQVLKDKWADLGIEYEEVHYLISHSINDKKRKLENIQKLYTKVVNLKKNDDTNYFIDLIFLVARFLCIRKEIKWLPEASGVYRSSISVPRPITESHV